MLAAGVVSAATHSPDLQPVRAGDDGIAGSALTTTLPPVTTPSLPATSIPTVTVPTVTVTVPVVTVPVITLPLAKPAPPFRPTSDGLWLIDADRTAGQRLLTGVAVDNVSYAPSGKEIAFTAQDGPVYDNHTPRFLGVLDVAAGGVRRLAPNANEPQEVAWSPDGHWIAFMTLPSGDGPPPTGSEIWVVRPDGSGLRKVVDSDCDCHLDWSPASDRLLIARPSLDDLAIVDVATGAARSIPFDNVFIDARWVSSRALVASDDHSTWLVDAVNGARHQISTVHYAVPSPNGRLVAVRDGDADGKTVVSPLAGGVGRVLGVGSPNWWSHDSRSLVFSEIVDAASVADVITGQVRIAVAGDATHMLSPAEWSPVSRAFLVIVSHQTAFRTY